jgi:NADPH:quinone reductase-like Zn-dependent oxidoreductase
MNAVIFNQHGGPEVLEYTVFPTPKPARGQALVRLKAAALNRMDLFVRAGWPGIKLQYPHILGADGAGEVVELGTGVTLVKPGDRVVINSNLSCGKCEFCVAGMDNRCREWALLGETVRGTYAEYVAIPEKNLYPLPDGFEQRAAASASLVFHTAWHSLVKRGRIRPGEHVLIVGASGGVNTASIQIAKLCGAIVYVVGSSAEKLKLAASLGADFLINRSLDENWSRTVFNMTDKRGVDVVIDNVATTYPHSFRAVCKGGRILNVGNTGGHRVEIDNRFVFAKHLSILGSTMGTRQDFSQVMDLVFAGKLKSVVDLDFRLSNARQAHEYLASGDQLGKVTLSIE